VVSILLKAFQNNKSVNYIAGKEEAKIRYLMEYSFENCIDTGKIFVSDNGSACAMIQFHDRKKSLWKNIFLDIQLILKTIGWAISGKPWQGNPLLKNITPRSLLPTSGLWE
jgi:hypothetical protein